LTISDASRLLEPERRHATTYQAAWQTKIGVKMFTRIRRGTIVVAASALVASVFAAPPADASSVGCTGVFYGTGIADAVRKDRLCLSVAGEGLNVQYARVDYSLGDLVPTRSGRYPVMACDTSTTLRFSPYRTGVEQVILRTAVVRGCRPAMTLVARRLDRTFTEAGRLCAAITVRRSRDRYTPAARACVDVTP
jgi:hypothetical protein